MTENVNARPLLQRIQEMDRLFCWSMVGAVVGLVSLVLAVYFAVFYERPAEITMDVVSQTPVLDIREDVDRLDIIYRGKNLVDLHSQLTVLVVRVANTGRSSILKSAFDEDNPLGYRVVGGAIAAVPVVSASSERLETLTLRDGLGEPLGRHGRSKNDPEPGTLDGASSLSVTKSKSEVYLPAFIFEPGEYFEHKLLIIHDTKVRPQVVSTGKIAGIRDISVRVPGDRIDTSLSWSAVTSGSLMTHVLRLFLYAGLLLLAVIGIQLIWVIGLVLRGFVFIFRRNRLRERLIRDFKRKHTDLCPFDAIIFNEFREGGWTRTAFVQELITSEYASQQHESDWLTDLRLRLTDCGLLQGRHLDSAFDARLTVFNKFVFRKKEEAGWSGLWGWA